MIEKYLATLTTSVSTTNNSTGPNSTTSTTTSTTTSFSTTSKSTTTSTTTTQSTSKKTSSMINTTTSTTSSKQTTKTLYKTLTTTIRVTKKHSTTKTTTPTTTTTATLTKKVDVSLSFALKPVDLSKRELVANKISKALYEWLHKVNPYESQGQTFVGVKIMTMTECSVNIRYSAPVVIKQVDSRKTIASKVIKSTQKALRSTEMKEFVDEAGLQFIKESVTVSKSTPNRGVSETKTVSKSNMNEITISIYLLYNFYFLE